MEDNHSHLNHKEVSLPQTIRFWWRWHFMACIELLSNPCSRGKQQVITKFPSASASGCSRTFCSPTSLLETCMLFLSFLTGFLLKCGHTKSFCDPKNTLCIGRIQTTERTHLPPSSSITESPAIMPTSAKEIQLGQLNHYITNLYIHQRWFHIDSNTANYTIE